MFKISIDQSEIDKLEMTAFPGRITVIDARGPEFNKAVSYLRRQKVLGFDTESRPSFSAGQPHYGVSLLQLSGPERAFLFRVKKIGVPKSLCSIMASENIIKVGAAVNDDVRGLQKISPFEHHGFLDLQQTVWEYGIKDKSVKKMAAIILGIRISKTQQLSNWECESLSEAQQKYAATDAWVCREMYLRLLKEEKHPLTPEQMLPNPPKAAPEDPVSAMPAEMNNASAGAVSADGAVPGVASSRNDNSRSRRARRRREYFRRRGRAEKKEKKND